MSRRRLIAFALALVLAMQVVRPARTNPPTDAGKTLEVTLAVPPAVRQILDRACRDCHSNDTRWPWYAQVAPVSWLVVHDVNKGRSELNFSTWGDYPSRRRTNLLNETCGEITHQAMPLRSYVLMHPEAALSAEDVRVLCAWTTAVKASASGAH